MQYPLIDRALLADLRLAHGAFNFIVMLLFLYQGWLGFRIRRARISSLPLPFPLIKRHRKAGPALAILGAVGFLAGSALVLIDTGNIVEHPAHLFAGVIIVFLLLLTYLVSRKIKGQSVPQRDYHFKVGIAILCMYLVNVLLGVGALL